MHRSVWPALMLGVLASSGGSARADEPLRPVAPESLAPPGWYLEPRPEEVSDPRVAMGLGLIGGGALFFAGGLSAFADAGTTTSESAVCNAGGCFAQSEVRDDPDGQSPGVAMTAGGAASALFGAVLLGHGLGDGHPLPAKSSRRLGAGMMLTGFGFGTTVGASALLMHAAIEDSEAGLVGFVMFAPAAGLLATGIPLWITGSRPPEGDQEARDPRGDREVMRSPTMASLGLGMSVIGLGIVGAGIGAAMEGERREEEEQQPIDDEFGYYDYSDRPDTSVTILGTMTAGVAVFSLGLPMAIIGLGSSKVSEAHASSPSLSMPDVEIGLTGANVSWRY